MNQLDHVTNSKFHELETVQTLKIQRINKQLRETNKNGGIKEYFVK